MADADIDIELSRERELILEYGCPFADAKAQLQAAASDDISLLTSATFVSTR